MTDSSQLVMMLGKRSDSSSKLGPGPQQGDDSDKSWDQVPSGGYAGKGWGGERKSTAEVAEGGRETRSNANGIMASVCSSTNKDMGNFACIKEERNKEEK